MFEKLGVSITAADGTVTRWGPDEANAKNVPQAISFGTSIPGGFKDCRLTLPRRIDLDYADLNLLDDIRVYGSGNETVWEGRVEALPRSHGDETSIEVGAVGWAAHLKDNPFFREIYVDRDLSHWAEMGATRRLTATGVQKVSDPTVVDDPTSAVPALDTRVETPWSASFPPLCEAWYDAGAGVTIGSLYYAWRRGTNVNNADANWSWLAALSTNDVFGAFDSSGNLRAAGPGTGTLSATTTTKRHAALQFSYGAVAGATNINYEIYWTALAAYGNHGLTKQGTEDAFNAKGFYASDVIANVVSRAAPLLNYTTGAGGSIESTTFTIPQLEFRDPVTAEDAILRTNAYHLWEWGVFRDREFFFRPPDPNRLCWEARLSEGAQLEFEGLQADDVFNGVIVTYSTPDGKEHTVGPPGSGAENTDSTLADTDPNNPVNAHGLPARYAQLSITPVTTLTGATQLGQIFLTEKELPQRRGSLTVSGEIAHPTKGKRPNWEVWAGDYVRIADHPTDVPRRIIETSWSNGTLTMTLDNSAFKLDAILERLGTIITGFTVETFTRR